MKTNLNQLILIIAFLGSTLTFGQNLQLQNSLAAKKSNVLVKQTKKETKVIPFEAALADTKPQRLKLEGKIYDAVANRSVAGAKIFIKEYNITVISDFDGSFQTETPVFGSLTVMISFPGMQQLIINTDDSNGNNIDIGKVFLKPVQTSVVYSN